MKTYSFYDSNTGHFVHGVFKGSERMLALNTPPGTVAIQGAHYPEKWRFNLESREVVSWKGPIDEGAMTAAARHDRDLRLAETDWTQMPDADLSEAEVNAWRAYRQSLRDITSSTGFPADITWPEKPA